jgi:hypothetical protein
MEFVLPLKAQGQEAASLKEGLRGRPAVLAGGYATLV